MSSAHSERRNMSEQEGLTIVLFGKTGNGKSSVGNIILGQGQGRGHGAQRHFSVSSGMASATMNTETRRTTRNGIPIEVIDIPDFTNLDDSSGVIKRDIISVKRKVANNPYVILLAVRCDVRYTKEEYDIYKEFRDLWGRDISSHLIVAFTFGDRQERDLGKELESVNPELKSVLKDARRRYVVFDDTADGNDKEIQAERLMATIHMVTTQAAVQPRHIILTPGQRVQGHQSMSCFRRVLCIVSCCGCFFCCDCCDDCCCACCNDFRFRFKDYAPY